MNRIIALTIIALSVTPLTRAQDAGAASLELKPSTNAATPLAYETNELTCKAAAKVKVTVNNVGGVVPQPHNFVLCKVGADAKVLAAAMGMLTDPQGMAKSYVPDSTDIIAHTKFAQPGQAESVEFIAPTDAGDYPFFCTFPGHAVLMKGVLKVTK